MALAPIFHSAILLVVTAPTMTKLPHGSQNKMHGLPAATAGKDFPPLASEIQSFWRSAYWIWGAAPRCPYPWNEVERAERSGGLFKGRAEDWGNGLYAREGGALLGIQMDVRAPCFCRNDLSMKTKSFGPSTITIDGNGRALPRCVRVRLPKLFRDVDLHDL